MNRKLIYGLLALCLAATLHGQNAFVTTGQELLSSVTGHTMSVSIGQIHYITVPDSIQAGEQQPFYYYLTLIAKEEGNGIVEGEGLYSGNSWVTISATATDDCYHFDHWSDGVKSNPRQIYLSGNMTLTAYFEKNKHTLTVDVDNPAHGTPVIIYPIP